MNLKILLNATNLRIGGSLQVLKYLIDYLQFKGLNYYIFASSEAYIYLLDHSVDKRRIISFGTPSIIPFYKCKSKKKYDNSLKKINPDVVFTLFGPSHWIPKGVKIHLLGFANAFFTNTSINFQDKRNFIQSTLFKLKKAYFKFLLKKNVDYYVVQTDLVKNGLAKWLNVDEEIIYIVPGGYDEAYFELVESKDFDKNLGTITRPIKLGFVSAYYPHKNFDIIVPLIQNLQNCGIYANFFVTLDDDIFDENFKNHFDYVKNWGVVSGFNLSKFYHNLDVVFFPSLLESFSAVYPESIVSAKPIICCDFDFSKSILSDHAFYFQPTQIESAVQAVKSVISSEDIKAFLDNAKLNPNFLSSSQVSERYLNLIQILGEIKL